MTPLSWRPLQSGPGFIGDQALLYTLLAAVEANSEKNYEVAVGSTVLYNHLYNTLEETTNHVYSTLEERIQNGQSDGHHYNTLEEATNHVCNNALEERSKRSNGTLEERNERSDGHVYNTLDERNERSDDHGHVYSTVKDVSRVLTEEGHIYTMLEQVVCDEVMITASHAFRITSS